MVERIILYILRVQCRLHIWSGHLSFSGGYRKRVAIYNWPIARNVKGSQFRRTEIVEPFLVRIPAYVKTNIYIQHLGILKKDWKQGTAQQRQYHEIVWHSINCGGQEAGKFNQEVKSRSLINIQRDYIEHWISLHQDHIDCIACLFVISYRGLEEKWRDRRPGCRIYHPPWCSTSM